MSVLAGRSLTGLHKSRTCIPVQTTPDVGSHRPIHGGSAEVVPLSRLLTLMTLTALALTAGLTYWTAKSIIQRLLLEIVLRMHDYIRFLSSSPANPDAGSDLRSRVRTANVSYHLPCVNG